jgi:hypothetical protein
MTPGSPGGKYRPGRIDGTRTAAAAAGSERGTEPQVGLRTVGRPSHRRCHADTQAREEPRRQPDIGDQLGASGKQRPRGRAAAPAAR